MVTYLGMAVWQTLRKRAQHSEVVIAVEKWGRAGGCYTRLRQITLLSRSRAFLRVKLEKES